ncbi:MAG TPA: GldG family protein, partial [Anaerolineales bacterium]|nr:GldG family protein [Anaerolineales bacterium]
MEIKGKHVYGLGAAVAGGVALIFALAYWFINRTLDSTVQAGFALGLIGLALFAWLEIDWLTRVLKTRQVRYGAETLALIAMFLVVVGLLNYIFTRDRLKTRWDLTENKQFTLAPETLTVLNGLNEPVKVLAFYSSSSFGREDAENLLKNYKEKSNGQLDYEWVDPFTKPALAQEYGITRDGALVVTRGNQREEVKFSDESSLTNAIVRLDDTTPRTVYFISGHGELSADDTGQEGLSTLKTYLEGVNIQVKTLNALGNSVPVDANAMVIAGPQRPYSAAAVELLGKYLSGGGRLIVLAEPSILMGVEAGQTDPLADYLSQSWGVTLRDDFIFETTYFSQSQVNLITANYESASPIVSGLENINAFFSLARSLEVAAQTPEGVTVTPIIKTWPTAWGETNVAALNGEGEVAQDQNEPAGELIVGLSAENSTNGRIVVFGDSQFGQNQFWQESNLSNGLLILNSIKWA